MNNKEKIEFSIIISQRLITLKILVYCYDYIYVCVLSNNELRNTENDH